MQRHQLGGILLALAATVLLSIATFTTPFSRTLYFLRATTSFGHVRFGGFGWCAVDTGECWGPVLGYHWDPQVTVWLTGAEVTIGIAALFALASLTCLILETTFSQPSNPFLSGGAAYAASNPLYFRASAVLASLLSILAFVFSAVLWYETRVRFEQSGMEARYGPALWILLGGTISASLSLCVGGPRFTGRHMYRANNQASYTV